MICPICLCDLPNSFQYKSYSCSVYAFNQTKYNARHPNTDFLMSMIIKHLLSETPLNIKITRRDTDILGHQLPLKLCEQFRAECCKWEITIRFLASYIPFKSS